VLQNISNGETQLVDIPCPQPVDNQLLIATCKTLISLGTEKMLIDFGKSGLIAKARSQPDKVKMVLDKVKTDGVLTTLETVKSKLNQPLPLGYCNVGIVQHAGNTGFQVGDRVVSNGGHAEIVRVSKNLCAKVPDNVDNKSAAFTVLAAIAMQGVRISKAEIGEVVVVTGLGLIGLITVQLLRASGCRVLGIDFDSNRCALAKSFGAEVVDLSIAETPVDIASDFSRGRGVDAVIITASTSSSEPVSQAANMCRKRGRVVLVGVVGLELSRADFYEKEITFQVSCSYGPGRYDKEYEESGIDYPVGFVRWTEQRNFESVLDLMSAGAINMEPLMSFEFDIGDAVEAYSKLEETHTLGVLLDYKSDPIELIAVKSISISSSLASGTENEVSCGFVGAGNYASRVLIPAFRGADVELNTLLTSGGVSAVHHGKKNGFLQASTEYSSILESDDINTVVIATQHHLHSEQVVQALDAGKHVFVEKPLALTQEGLDEIEKAYFRQGERCKLMVGYNRRFAPHTLAVKERLSFVKGAKTFIFTMNAGDIPFDHWVHDPSVGGGRILGEACHYIDLMRFLAGCEIESFFAASMGKSPSMKITEDKSCITLQFSDGSVGVINYFANGGKSFPKERVEVFANGGVLQIDNFRRLVGFDWPGIKKSKLVRQDKGQNYCVRSFVESIRAGTGTPISFSEIMEVSRLSIDIASSLR